jgi:hypothetical protein
VRIAGDFTGTLAEVSPSPLLSFAPLDQDPVILTDHLSEEVWEDQIRPISF